MLQELMLEQDLVNTGQVDAARERQKIAGGSLLENLLALGIVNRTQLVEMMQEAPPVPKTVEETGLSQQFLIDLTLKTLRVTAVETIPELAAEMHIAQRLVQLLIDEMRDQRMVEIMGAVDAAQLVLRHVLTDQGRARARDALEQSAYVGPAPVALEDYKTQIQRQSILTERINPETLREALSHLVLDESIINVLGPACNSGKALLLYGPSGNGKSSIAEAVARAYQEAIYVPHCIEVGGQVIKVFDPAVHQPTEDDEQPDALSEFETKLAEYDSRWVRCRRPTVVSGGELTLGMLDLDFDPISKYYEAPLQVKAMGGIYVIDDFGRQLVSPTDLLNRWIVPLEMKVDFLTLHTGKKFQLPFDELVVFSTNVALDDLLDDAMLRRIKYKVPINAPTPNQYRAIFKSVCDLYGLGYSDELVSALLQECYQSGAVTMASYHPKFIVEHVLSVSKYEGSPPELTMALAKEALEAFVGR